MSDQNPAWVSSLSQTSAMRDVFWREPLKVLVVDDHPFHLRLLKTLLNACGFQLQLTLCTSYKHATDEIQKQDFDIAILDYLLDNQHTGLELLQETRLAQAGIASVVVTSYTERDFGFNAIKTGADEFLPKHEMTPDTLARAIVGAMRRNAVRTETKTNGDQG